MVTSNLVAVSVHLVPHPAVLVLLYLCVQVALKGIRWRETVVKQ